MQKIVLAWPTCRPDHIYLQETNNKRKIVHNKLNEFFFMIFIDTILLNVQGWCIQISAQGKNAFYVIINI